MLSPNNLSSHRVSKTSLPFLPIKSRQRSPNRYNPPMNNSIRSYSFTFALLTLCLCAGSLNAQEATAADVAEVKETTLWDRFEQGGWAMWPLLGLSVGAIGLIMYNGMMIRPKVLAPEESIQQLKELAAALDIEGLNAYCEANINPITNIFAAGMERITPDEFDPESVGRAVEDATAEELAGPFSMINFLNVIANIAPMVGMLGTVSGMVKAFGNIASSGGMADPVTMANNISEALITTMSGLTVAIPAMFAYFLIKNKYGKIVAGMSRSIGGIYHVLGLAVRNPDLAASLAQQDGLAQDGVSE